MGTLEVNISSNPNPNPASLTATFMPVEY